MLHVQISLEKKQVQAASWLSDCPGSLVTIGSNHHFGELFGNRVDQPDFNWVCFSPATVSDSLLHSVSPSVSRLSTVHLSTTNANQFGHWRKTRININSRPQTNVIRSANPSISVGGLCVSAGEKASAWYGVMWLLALALPLLLTTTGNSYRDAGFPDSKWPTFCLLSYWISLSCNSFILNSYNRTYIWCQWQWLTQSQMCWSPNHESWHVSTSKNREAQLVLVNPIPISQPWYIEKSKWVLSSHNE